MMKNRSVLLWSLLTIAVSLVGGYCLRNVVHGSHLAKESGFSSPNATSSKSTRVERGQKERLRSQQARISIEQSNGSERWLHWISAIEGASLDDFPQLARVAQNDERFLQLLAQRWFDSDPEHFFHTLEKESKLLSESRDDLFPHAQLRDLLFGKWIRKDIDAAIEALSSSTELLGRSEIRASVFGQVMELDPRHGLPLLNKWGIHNRAPSKKGVEKWARENPKEAASAILENAGTFGAESCMKAVAEVWAKSDPEGALSFAVDAKGREGEILRRTAFQEWVSNDIAAASDWLMERDDPGLDELYRPLIIEEWAKEEPNEALAWCEEHLTGADLNKAISRLAAGVAEVDIESAAEWVGQLESRSTQQRVARAVAKEWFPDVSVRVGRIPPKAVEWLRNIEDAEVKGAALSEISESWSEHDLRGIKEFLSEEVNLSLPVSSFDDLVEVSVRKDPEGTLEWASRMGEERSLSVSEVAFGDWLHTEATQAASWFAGLPSDDARRLSMLKTWVLEEYTFSRQGGIALEQLSALSASDRAQARTMLENSQIGEERKKQILEILKE